MNVMNGVALNIPHVYVNRKNARQENTSAFLLWDIARLTPPEIKINADKYLKLKALNHCLI